MKIEWQADDIQAGRRVGRPDRGEQWMIGYFAWMKSDEPRWVLVSLADGMVHHAITREALAAKLNDSGDLPLELLPAATRGAKGGRARAASLTPERKSEIASAAGNARWDKQRLANEPPAEIPDDFQAPLDGRTTIEMMADRDAG